MAQNPGDFAGVDPVDLGNLGKRHAVLHQGPDTHELRARDLAHCLRLGGGRSFALLVTDWHRNLEHAIRGTTWAIRLIEEAIRSGRRPG